jgi:hypothetical protein
MQPEHRGEQHDAAVAVLDVGGVNDSVEQQAQRIYDNVALFALDLLARIPRVAPKARPRTGSAVRINARPPFSALFTLWLSIMAAVGLACRDGLRRRERGSRRPVAENRVATFNRARSFRP